MKFIDILICVSTIALTYIIEYARNPNSVLCDPQWIPYYALGTFVGYIIVNKYLNSGK